MILSVNILYLGKCNSCCKQSHGRLGEGSACVSIAQLCIHGFTAIQLTSCSAFPTSLWVSSMGVSGTAAFCTCGKIQKLQIHEINPLGDLPVNNPWADGLFSFVLDHNWDLELFASLVGRGVNLHLTCVWCSELAGRGCSRDSLLLVAFCIHHTFGSDRYINHHFYHVIACNPKISNCEHSCRLGLTFSALLYIDIYYFFIGNIKSF